MHKTTKLKKYDISMEDIASIFKYSSTASFNSSSAKPRLIAGIETIIELVETAISQKISE